MGKYNLYATRQDWEKLYKEVEALGLDVKPFKKSQSLDSASVQLDILKRNLKVEVGQCENVEEHDTPENRRETKLYKCGKNLYCGDCANAWDN